MPVATKEKCFFDTLKNIRYYTEGVSIGFFFTPYHQMQKGGKLK